MTIQLHITGPGLDVLRTLASGEPELVLGRDADCHVRLPDPQRNVSRRHLALWLEQGELKFRVLSVVNGVDMPLGEVPPGALGVLPMGQVLHVGDYSVIAELLAEPAAVLSPPPIAETLQPSSDDDPFGDWGFQTTFGPGVLGPPPLEAGDLTPGPVPSFFQGLGLDPATVGALSDNELQTIGRLVRVLALGLLELDASASAAKHEMRAEDRTMIADKDTNPLEGAWSEETKLRYLFGGRAAGAGFVHPERALRELLAGLIAHNSASGAAVRGVLGSTLKEFSPATLKTRLLGHGPKLFQNTRLWGAYCRYYDQEGQDLGKWTQRLVDRYFAEAYLRESLRIKRETAAPPR